MKRIITALGILLVILVAFTGASCKSETPTSPIMPPRNGGVPGATLEVSCDEFMQQNHLAKQVEITYPGSLVVSLCSNPTTGFQWNETAQISDPAVLQQYEHNFVPPEQTGLVGAAGKDVWTFKPLEKGTATVSMEYSRPWEGGEKGAWTYTMTVNVK